MSIPSSPSCVVILTWTGEIVPTGPDASKPQKKHHVDTASLSTGQMVKDSQVALGLSSKEGDKTAGTTATTATTTTATAPTEAPK